MKKSKKITLIVMGACSCLSALVMPIFLQWYEQQTGIYPIGFVFVYCISIFVAVFSQIMPMDFE